MQVLKLAFEAFAPWLARDGNGRVPLAQEELPFSVASPRLERWELPSGKSKAALVAVTM